MRQQILLYRTVKRHKLIKRFTCYHRLATWILKNIKASEFKNYNTKTTKNIR